MSTLRSRSSLGADLRAVTEETGTAVVHDRDRTFVVIEVDREPVEAPKEPYRVVESEEAAALMDALDDTDNPSYGTADALTYLQERRTKHPRRD